jgi:hypothetical protein
MKKALAILGLGLFVSSCVSTQIVLQPKADTHRRADYEDYFDYYAFGLIGDNSVDVQKACMDQKPQKIQRLRSFEDGLISFYTLGIYTPLTVRVWCGD